MILFFISASLFLLMSLIMMSFGLYFMLFKLSMFIEWNLLMLNSMSMNMLILIDWLSLIFIFTVMLISSMILFYCSEYMSRDKNWVRFFI